jgi:PAS domain S-box-containing protein
LLELRTLACRLQASTRARLVLRALGYWAVAAAIVGLTLAAHRWADDADRRDSQALESLSRVDLAERTVLDALGAARADVHLLAALGVVGEYLREPSLVRRTALARDLFAFVATRDWCERVAVRSGAASVSAERRPGEARCEALAGVAAGFPASEALIAAVPGPPAAGLCLGIALGAAPDGRRASLMAEVDPRVLFAGLAALSPAGAELQLRDASGQWLLPRAEGRELAQQRAVRLHSWSGPSAGSWQLGLTRADEKAEARVPHDIGITVLLLLASVPGALALARASEARRDAERIAERQLALFQSVSDNAPSPIFLKDGSGRYLACNAAFERLAGRTREAIVGREIADVLPAEARQVHEQVDRAILADGVARRYEARVPVAGGRTLDLLVSKAAVRDDDGRITGLTGALVDITEHKAAQRELLRSVEALRSAGEAAEAGTRAKSEFLALMSHEMRTPLHAVLGATTLLLEQPLAPGQREQAELARTAGQALLELIDDLLDYSRLEAGRIDLERIAFDPARLVSDTVALVAAAAREKRLELGCAVDADVPRRVSGDPGRLRQVLLRLLGNAIEFTERGSVRARLSVAGSDEAGVRLRLVVTDTGVGMTPELLARLFQPFAVGESAPGASRAATGLGLSVTRRLVELMGGTIEVASTPGAGSEFRCTIPLGLAPVEIAPVEAPRAEPASALPRDLRVLVVEDNRVNQRVTRALLEHLGCAADVADDGRAALAALENATYDLVLMDCSMPGMSGYEATREIRRRGLGGAQLPIVALTAHSLRGDRERCLAAGMTGYLPKPVDLAALERVLRSLAPGASSARGQAAGAGAPGAASTLVDVTALDGLRALEKDGPGFLATIVREFDEGTRRRLDEMQLAVRGGDLPGLRGAAHTLKGSAGIFGANGMTELCRRLEQAAERDEASAAGPLIARLAREHEAVMSVLQEATASL